MDTDVIIVGAGPVGLMLAGELRLGGADVVVLERLAAPTSESRASTLHARTMEIFDQRGLLESLGSPPNVGMGHFGGLPLDLTGLRTPFAGQWKVPQTRVEELLQEWAVGLGAEVRRGFDVRALSVAEDHVEVLGPDAADYLRAAFVVGCDGEDSTVRRLAGIGITGHDASKELLRADVDGIDVPDRRFQRLPGGLAIAARRPDGVTRVMVHQFGRPAGEASFGDVAVAWGRVTGEDISGGTPIWVNAFGNASRLADRYREGRVILAGDAAHQQLPVGGQALNLGLQDAVNLGWKLAAEAAGRAPRGLLDSYHDERHQVGRRTLDNIEAQTLLLLGGDDVDAVRAMTAELMAFTSVRDHLAAMISGLDIRYGAAGLPGHPLLGARVPPEEIETELGKTTVAALLRSARGLFIDFSSGGLAAPEGALADRVDFIRATGATAGPLADIEAVLVRPDGHVAWISGTTAELHTALQRWFGAQLQRA